MKKCEYCGKDHKTKWKYCSNMCVENARLRAAKESQIEKTIHDTYMSELWKEALRPQEAWIIKIDEHNHKVYEP